MTLRFWRRPPQPACRREACSPAESSSDCDVARLEEMVREARMDVEMAFLRHSAACDRTLQALAEALPQS